MNATSGTGWKNEDDTACMDFKGNQFIECIERHAYSKEELHLESNKNVKFRQIFVVNLTAILQSLEIRQGDITSKAKSAMEIKLNHNLNYFVYITDPALEFFFDSPSIIPRIMLSLKDQTGLLLHLEVPCYYILHPVCRSDVRSYLKFVLVYYFSYHKEVYWWKTCIEIFFHGCHNV